MYVCVCVCMLFHHRERFKPGETKLPLLSIPSHISSFKYTHTHTHTQSSSEMRISEQGEICYLKEEVTVSVHVRHEE